YVILHDPITTVHYTLSLHDALPILLHDLTAVVGEGLAHEVVLGASPGFDRIAQLHGERAHDHVVHVARGVDAETVDVVFIDHRRSEEHTSELQSRENLVCRLLLEKK